MPRKRVKNRCVQLAWAKRGSISGTCVVGLMLVGGVMLLVLLIDILCLALSSVCVCCVADTTNDSSIRYSIHSLGGFSSVCSPLQPSVAVVSTSRPEVIQNDAEWRHRDLVTSEWRHGDEDDDDGDDVGRRESRRAQRRWHSSRDLQGHPEENPSHPAVSSHRGASKLRSDTEWVFLRPAPGRLRTDTQLLPHRQTALPDRRVWPALWGGTWLLGSRR